MARDTDIRLFVDDPLSEAAALPLGRDQSHYLANVMRLKAGDSVLLFNGRDGEWRAEVTEVAKRAVTLTARSRTREQRPEPDLWLAFAPIKKARLDFIAQKATELGVRHMLPVMTRRTIVDRVKTDRMHANAVEAAEQCERLNVPSVGEPMKLEALMDSWPAGRRLMFCDEDKTGTPAHTALQAVAEKAAPGPWGVLIGPEGGFDDKERALIRAHPATVTVALGPRVLRADTAAITALSLWQSALGDW